MTSTSDDDELSSVPNQLCTRLDDRSVSQCLQTNVFIRVHFSRSVWFQSILVYM